MIEGYQGVNTPDQGRCQHGEVSPNQPKTPIRSIRVPDEIWDPAKVKVKAEGTNLSELIREFLAEYIDEDEDE